MTREEAIEIIKRNCTSDSDLRKACKLFIPELTESEDEKMLREIKRYIKEQGNKPTGLPNGTVAVYDMIDWLEKQKDSLHIEKTCKDNIDTFTDEDEKAIKSMTRLIKAFYDCNFPTPEGFERKDLLAWLKKQKDASKAIEAVERIDKYIDRYLANAHDMDDSNPYKKYYRGWDDALGKMAGILQDVYSEAEQKEQKPVEYLDKDKIYAIMKKLHELAFSHRILIYSDEYKKINEITSDVRSLLDYPIETKPAEWSNLDKDILNDAITAVDLLGNDESFNKSNPNLANAFRVAKDWLETLPGRFNVKQEKQEWTKEDENMLLKLLMMIDTANDYEEIRLWLCTKLNVVTSTELDRKLKSDMTQLERYISTQLERYISEARTKKGFYWNNKYENTSVVLSNRDASSNH